MPFRGFCVAVRVYSSFEGLAFARFATAATSKPCGFLGRLLEGLKLRGCANLEGPPYKVGM